MMLRWGQEDIWQQTNSEEEGALGRLAVPIVQDAAPITIPICFGITFGCRLTAINCANADYLGQTAPRARGKYQIVLRFNK